MIEFTLFQAIEHFAAVTYALADKDLDRPWQWREYNEGVRFAFFRTCEELCEMGAHLEIERAASTQPMTVAQRILAQHHAACRDLQAVLLGVTDELAGQAPAEEVWSIRQALVHIIQAERGFFTANHYGLEGARTGDGRPLEMTEEYWNAFWADAPFAELSETGSFAALLDYDARLHPRVLREFAGVTAQELSLPIKFWENELMPLEFRLHRFSSHRRQHTIQIEKTLDMLEHPPSEAKRLLRMIFNALAAVESVTFGVEDFGIARLGELAAEINRRAEEIAAIVA